MVYDLDGLIFDIVLLDSYYSFVSVMFVKGCCENMMLCDFYNFIVVVCGYWVLCGLVECIVDML